jgi:hypothetical protein
LWLTLFRGSPQGWLVIAGCALAVGLASGAWGDAFWHGLRDWLWWWH